MSTVLVFVTLVVFLALLMLLVVCWQSQARTRELAQQQAAEAAAAAQRASLQQQQQAAMLGGLLFPTAPRPRPGFLPTLPPSGAPPLVLRPHAASARPPPGARKWPTPAAIISNLPTYKFQQQQQELERCSAPPPAAGGGGTGSGSEGGPACVICCCEYEQGDLVKLLPCLHGYHAECIDAWLVRDHVCPVCQADVVLAAGLSAHGWADASDAPTAGVHTPGGQQPPGVQQQQQQQQEAPAALQLPGPTASPARPSGGGVAEPSTPTALGPPALLEGRQPGAASDGGPTSSGGAGSSGHGGPGSPAVDGSCTVWSRPAAAGGSRALPPAGDCAAASHVVVTVSPPTAPRPDA